MDQARYAELEIRILARQAQGYPIEITCDGSQFPRGYLRPDILPWMPRGSPQKDGETLFDWLLTDDRLKAAWAEARGRSLNRRIRLRIDADTPELHALPWEFLCDSTQILAADTATPFSRYLASPSPVPPPLRARPVRILVIIANPDNLPEYGLTPLDVAVERRILTTALARIRSWNVSVAFLAAPVTMEALEAELKHSFDCLYVVAHGAIIEGEAVLFLADSSNRVAVVGEDALADLIRRQGSALRLVFLAACQSATHDSTDALRGFAPQLVAAGVPAVVAMQGRVPEPVAQKFAAVFFRRLLRHGRVDLAANEARSALLSAQLHEGWGVPVLYSRVRDGWLIGPAARWRMALATLVILIVAAMAFLAIGQTYDWFVRPRQGGFWIAVTLFTVTDDAERMGCGGVASQLGELLTSAIDSEAKRSQNEYPIGVIRPNEIRQVKGGEQEAAKIATRFGARILIYGQVTWYERSCQVEPEFYVMPGAGFAYGSEVTGATRLGKPVPVVVPITETNLRGENVRLAGRVEALKHLVIGLSNFYSAHYEEAASQFLRADAVAAWQADEGKEVAQLLSGAAWLRIYHIESAENEKENALREANEAFAQAYSLNRQYARAYLGLASVLLAQAHGFQKPADDVRLHEALDLYTASRGAIDQPESAYVSIKADFGSGQVHLVGFLDDLPGWSDEEARQLFQRVIRAYDSERAPEIQWLAGESHYYLAALAKQREAWQQVEEECREAIKLLEPLPVENTCEHVTQCWWWKADAEAQQRHFADARRDSELMLAAGKKCMRQNQLDEWKKTLDMLLQGAQRSSNPTADGSK